MDGVVQIVIIQLVAMTARAVNTEHALPTVAAPTVPLRKDGAVRNVIMQLDAITTRVVTTKNAVPMVVNKRVPCCAAANAGIEHCAA